MTTNEGISLTNNLIDKALGTTSFHLSDMTRHISLSKGKGVRTQLLLSSAMQTDGTTQPAAAKAAAAVELLHMATLVHDDVIDDAPIRRGIETLHRKFGKKEAVICGDYLLCVALNMVSDFFCEDYQKYGNLLPVMTKALSRICEGEYRQLRENKNINLSIYDYLGIITGKTASLFRISAYCGSIIGGCEEEELKRVSLFGKYLGIIFQIIDDCKDYEQSEEQAKKPVKNDLAQGVVTLPLIFALRKNKELKQLANQVMSNGENLELLVKEIINSGAVEDTRNAALRYSLKAEKCLSNIKNEAKKECLLNILEQVQKSL